MEAPRLWIAVQTYYGRAFQILRFVVGKCACLYTVVRVKLEMK
jgi:hypothetical protein